MIPQPFLKSQRSAPAFHEEEPMSQTIPEKKRKLRTTEESTLSRLIRFILLIVFDAAALWFIRNALASGFDQLAVVIGIIIVMFNLIYLLPQAYPFRWMASNWINA